MALRPSWVRILHYPPNKGDSVAVLTKKEEREWNKYQERLKEGKKQTNVILPPEKFADPVKKITWPVV